MRPFIPAGVGSLAIALSMGGCGSSGGSTSSDAGRPGSDATTGSSSGGSGSSSGGSSGADASMSDDGGDDAGTSDAKAGKDSGSTTSPDGGLSTLSVKGTQIVDSNGNAILLHGVDRCSLEWSKTGENISQSDINLMAQKWNSRTVRVPMNQDFWLSGAALYSAGYPAIFDQLISWAEEAGMYVILDLHWSDLGNLAVTGAPGNGQQEMADTNSITFWKEVAARYKNRPSVLFELYNEPHDVSWSIWKSGGMATSGSTTFTAAGMQQLYDAVRGTGANNVVVVGGLSWASDLSGVPANALTGTNIVYNVHVYDEGSPTPPAGGWSPGWDHNFGSLTATNAVMSTEFGTMDCSTEFVSQLIAYYDAHHMSWTSWAWFPSGCSFPSIVSDWNGTPSMGMGQTVQTALLGY